MRRFVSRRRQITATGLHSAYRLSPFAFRLSLKGAAFPLNELFIAAVLIALIALGLYFFAGAWGVFLLWCLSLLFVVPQGLATVAIVEAGSEERAKGRRGSAGALLACAVLWFVLWLALTAYCGHSAYLAYKALP